MKELKKKEEYGEPKIEIIILEKNDIITTSNPEDTDCELPQIPLKAV